MMTTKKSGATPAASLLPAEKDLHQDPLISMSGLLKLLSGANAMSLKRWRDSRNMPAPVAHGKYSVTATLRWVWDWRCELEEEADKLRAQGRTGSAAAEQMEQIKLRRMLREEAAELRTLVDRADYEQAEADRISVAVAILETIPDQLINLGVLKEEGRDKARDLVAEAIDSIRAKIETGDDDADAE